MKRIATILVTALVATSCIKDDKAYVKLPGVTGPQKQSVILPEKSNPWDEYSNDSPNALAIHVADRESAWSGITHALKTWGVPIRVTDNLNEALKHRVIFIYPHISGKNFSAGDLDKIRQHVRMGGAVITGGVLGGGLQDVFGVADPFSSKERYNLTLKPGHPLCRKFTLPEERSLRFANPDRKSTILGTNSYRVTTAAVLAEFNDGNPAIFTSRYGKGSTMTWGFDPGFLFLKGYNDTDDEASRHYINHYEPTIDVMARIMKEFYIENYRSAPTLGTVPHGKKLSVIITHDVDYIDSLQNSLVYAAYEKSQGISATYFMQAKYFRDFFDTVFFDDKTEKLMTDIRDMGMEIASHSVCHSDVFAILPEGTGKENYPEYQPRVMAMKDTRHGTVLGELRVSKYLLEHFSKVPVVSFRPGFLSYPKSLPQALESTGYRYSSSIAANNALTQMPYRLNYNRNYRIPTSIFEFPIAIEDEKEPRMDKRVVESVNLAKGLASSGGLCVILIHPNITDYKLAFLQQFVPQVKPYSWFGSLAMFGGWWKARDRVIIKTGDDETGTMVNLDLPLEIEGLVIEKNGLGKLLMKEPADIEVTDGNDTIMIKKARGAVRFRFARK